MTVRRSTAFLPPARVLKVAVLARTGYFHFAVVPDGQRFFVAEVPTASGTTAIPLTVVLNWTAALTQ